MNPATQGTLVITANNGRVKLFTTASDEIKQALFPFAVRRYRAIKIETGQL